MNESNRLEEFLDCICDQIRWKQSHEILRIEIENHIIDQKEAFLREGLLEDDALEKAIEEMGDPITIGTELDRTHRPKIEWKTLGLSLLMVTLGFAIRYLASLETDTSFMMTTSLFATVIGLVFMGIIYSLDFTLIGRYPKLIFMGLLILSIPSLYLGPFVNGRLIHLEFLLRLYGPILGGIIYSMRDKAYLGLALSWAFTLIPVFMSLLVPSPINFSIILLTFFILIGLAITRGWFKVDKKKALLMVSCLVLVSSFLIFVYFYKYRPWIIERAYKSAFFWIGSESNRPIMDLILKEGKFIGSMPEVFELPIEVNTDYILTYIIYRLGWLAFFIVVATVFIFIVNGFKLCFDQKSILGKLISIPVMISLASQSILYLMSNLGWEFGSSILPFISYSGRATITSFILVGILLSVFKSDYLLKEDLVLEDEV